MTVLALVCVVIFAAGVWYGHHLARGAMGAIVERFIKEMWAKRPRRKP